MSKEEIIRGENAIRQVIHEWRQHLITNWRSEPMRLTRAIPSHGIYGHLVTFQDGHTGWLQYWGNDVRYPFYWGCNLVGFEDGYKPPEKQAIGLSDAYPDVHKLPAIGRFQAVIPAIYDPVLLLFYHLADDLTKGEPITAREIVDRSEQAFDKREQDDYGNNWICVSGYWYPAELLTIARERL